MTEVDNKDDATLKEMKLFLNDFKEEIDRVDNFIIKKIYEI